MYIVARNLDDVTGGVAGLSEIPYLSIGSCVLERTGRSSTFAGSSSSYLPFSSDNVGRTRIGRAYHAIRSNEIAAQAAGIDVQQNMRNVFCFSALLASVAGSLLAHFITFVSPETFVRTLPHLLDHRHHRRCQRLGAAYWRPSCSLVSRRHLVAFRTSARGLYAVSCSSSPSLSSPTGSLRSSSRAARRPGVWRRLHEKRNTAGCCEPKSVLPKEQGGHRSSRWTVSP